jgi:hypothetical protein
MAKPDIHDLHPGVVISLKRLGMDELGVAKAIRDGDLVSPQNYENVTFFALRITGTGVSYRSKLEEYVYRDPSLYLNKHFLERCNGLPVIWEHPDKGKLDTKEFLNRIIGTIVLPYIRDEEVWGIAKIYDEEAAHKMESKQLSTSPAVVFRSTDGNQHATLEDGSALLVEGKPSLLDHLAICEEGVWDKGRDPTGVELSITTSEGSKMPEMEEKMHEMHDKRDDAASGGNLDRLLEGVDALCDRLDAMEKRMDSMSRNRKDDDSDDDDDDKMAHRKDAKHRKDDDDDDDDKMAHRKDAKRHRMDDDEGEMMGEPKELAADKHHRKDAKPRKDASGESFKKWAEEEGKELSHKADDDDDDNDDDDDDDDDDDKMMHRKDARRRMDDDRHERMDSNRKMEKHLASEIRRLQKSIAAMPKSFSDEDYAAMADCQARADSVYGAFGERAPSPLQGENLGAYRIRLAKGIQKHSPAWKDVPLRALPGTAMEIAEKQIYADAAAAARSPADLPSGHLREIRRRDAADRMITEFVGEPNSWMGSFRTPARSISKPFFRPRAGN